MADRTVTRRSFIKTSARTATAALSTAMVLPQAGCTRSHNYEFDVLIKNGTIYDGSLSAPVRGDIAIKNDLIVRVGTVQGDAARIIDARSMMVTPGFIDVHTHCDLTFEKSGIKRHLARFMPSWKGNHNYLYQGVTTVITGNCGWGYTDTDHWLSMVEDLGFGTNVGHLTPHGILREEVLRDGDPNIRELSAAQMDRFKGRVRDELAKGAFGMSAGLEYAPGLFAGDNELKTLCRELAKQDRVFSVHMRDESGTRTSDKGFGVLEAIDDTLGLARATGVNLEISHFKISTPFNGLAGEQILAPVIRARQEGMNVHADQYPYAAGSTVLTILLPHEMKKGAGVRDEFKTVSGRSQIQTAIKGTFRHLPPEKILITMNDADDAIEGKTLLEAARMRNQDPSDTFTDLATQDTPPMAVFFAQNMDVVKTLMGHDFIITASDGYTVPKDMTQPHPRTYGTFPRKLKTFSMDQHLLPLETAVHSMTGLPAQKFKIPNRGRILPGFFADLLVIDPARLKAHATYQSPHQYATGITHLFINGVHAISEGVHTGDRGGRALRARA